MIINLFSIFDPTTSYNFSLNWLSIFLPIIFIPKIYWITPSRPQFIITLTINFIIKELKNNISKQNLSTLLIFFRLFWSIITLNLLSLYPYLFTPTRHLPITITLALPLWLRFILFGWINISKHIFSHLIPNGTPIILSVFIVFIETTRNIIRPLTLSIRLRANIIAGHLLLSLLRNIREQIILIYFPTLVIFICLLGLEYAVALIQSYVFITLLSLYLNEIN